MAARTWLLKLERAGHIRLPPRRGPSSNGSSESSRADRGACDRSDPVCAARDAWIGWDRPARARHLQRLTNNTRFLVLPWVTVPHLASHVLGVIARRIRADWQAKYGHPVQALIDHLLDIKTAVDTARAAGLAALRRVFAGDPFVPAVHTS